MSPWDRRRRNAKRLARIAEVAAKHGLGYFVQTLDLGNLLPVPARRQRFKPVPAEIAARKVREMLEELGPTFVKLGQLLSIRPDLVPPDFVFELERLQDAVAPLPLDVIRTQVEHGLGSSIDGVFSRFDDDPLGSASIGQVHRAKLKEGPEVAVKIQRPGAEEAVDADLDLLRALARRVRDRVQWIDILDVLEEFAASLGRELDYRVEAHHIDRFRHNFRDDPLIKIPIVFWKYTTRRVLVMEYIEGSKLSDMATPEALGIDTFELAKHGAEAFMRQVLEHGFFHGDLHPANLLVTPDGRIGYLDFGIVGTVSESDKETITLMLVAMLAQDADEVVAQAANLGVEIPREKIPGMRAELRQILFRYYGKSLDEIHIDILGREFLAMLYRNHIKIPKDFALLAKALITIEGVAKNLYPEFNVLDVAKPYATNLIKEEYSAERGVEQAVAELRQMARFLAEMPRQLHDIFGMVRGGQLLVRSKDPDRDRLEGRIDMAASRIAFSVVLAAVIIAVALMAAATGIGWIAVTGFGFVVLMGVVWTILMVAGWRK